MELRGSPRALAKSFGFLSFSWVRANRPEAGGAGQAMGADLTVSPLSGLPEPAPTRWHRAGAAQIGAGWRDPVLWWKSSIKGRTRGSRLPSSSPQGHLLRQHWPQAPSHGHQAGLDPSSLCRTRRLCQAPAASGGSAPEQTLGPSREDGRLCRGGLELELALSQTRCWCGVGGWRAAGWGWSTSLSWGCEPALPHWLEYGRCNHGLDGPGESQVSTILCGRWPTPSQHRAVGAAQVMRSQCFIKRGRLTMRAAG